MNMDLFRNIVYILTVIGVPSLITSAGLCWKACRRFSTKIDILMNAVQKQMRESLMNKYHFYMKQGWITDDDLIEWEASYQAYHSLAINGIMDSKRDDLMRLPNEKPN